MDTVVVTLPEGFSVGGDWHRDAALRALNGRDESFLEEVGLALFPAQQTTALLARCLTRLGPLEPVPTEAVRSLTVGDREALLLHLRRLTLGDRMQCILNCPDPECGEKMDLELNVNDLLMPPQPHPQERYVRTIRENGTTYRVRFRLPTGADQEVAAPLAVHDAEAAAKLLLRRCVEQVAIEAEDEKPVEGLPSAVTRALPQLMAEQDSQAELMLSLTCPVCGNVFPALFDAAAYFFQELRARVDHLYREVHLLAFHYHWSEAEIMTMTPRKRQLYLGLLSDAMKHVEH